jgi:hypothetical protein
MIIHNNSAGGVSPSKGYKLIFEIGPAIRKAKWWQ